MIHKSFMTLKASDVAIHHMHVIMIFPSAFMTQLFLVSSWTSWPFPDHAKLFMIKWTSISGHEPGGCCQSATTWSCDGDPILQEMQYPPLSDGGYDQTCLVRNGNGIQVKGHTNNKGLCDSGLHKASWFTPRYKAPHIFHLDAICTVYSAC